MITIGAGIDTRLGALEHPEEVMLRPPASLARGLPRHREAGRLVGRLARWMIRGYQETNATDLASAIAFQALVAIVPMFLLLISVAGLFLQDSWVLQQAILTIAWVLPKSASGDAFTAAFQARSNSGFYGALSLLGFAWVGTGFVSALARSMNRIYRVPNAGYIKEKQRGFIVILLFALFFMISASSSIVTTFFVGDRERLPVIFQRWVLANTTGQVIAYTVALLSSFLLFMTIYRLIPNAKQRITDVWPGAVVGALLFLAVTQVFPIYLRWLGGANRYGVALGLLSLMVAAFYAIAHVILFGTYINATWMRHRERKTRTRRRRERGEIEGVPHGPFRQVDPQALRVDIPDQTLR